MKKKRKEQRETQNVKLYRYGWNSERHVSVMKTRCLFCENKDVSYARRFRFLIWGLVLKKKVFDLTFYILH